MSAARRKSGVRIILIMFTERVVGALRQHLKKVAREASVVKCARREQRLAPNRTPGPRRAVRRRDEKASPTRHLMRECEQ